MKNVLLIAMLLFFALSTAVYAGVDMKEGMWEVTMEMEMEGMPMQMPMTNSQKECITKDDLVPTPKDEDPSCKVKHTISGNRLEWTAKCDNGESKGEIVYSGSTYSGTMTTRMNDGGRTATMKAKLKGKWIGTCTAADKRAMEAKQQEQADYYRAQGQQAQDTMDQHNRQQAEQARKAAAVMAYKYPTSPDPGSCKSMDNPTAFTAPNCQPFDLREGMYEIFSESANEMKGLQAYFEGDNTETVCVSGDVSYGISGLIDRSECRRDIKRGKGRIVYNLVCAQGGMRQSVKGGMSFSGDTFEGGFEETTITSGTESTRYLHTRARRVGDCPSRGYTARGRSYTAQQRPAPSMPSMPSVPSRRPSPQKDIKGLFGF